MKYTAPVFICLIFLVACSKEYLSPAESELVVEGWIESGENPRVILTKTVPADGKTRSTKELDYFVVTMARVSVIDDCDGKEYILTGHRDKGSFPPYVYSNTSLKGVPGRTYSLKVLYGSLCATARATVPEPVMLQNLKAQKMGDGTGNYMIIGTVANEPGVEIYYRSFILCKGRDTEWVPSYQGVFEGKNISAVAELPIYGGVRLPDISNNVSFPPGAVVGIKFCTMERQMFEYWKASENMYTLSRNPLFPPTTDLPSNVDGALGYWAGYGLHRSEIKIPSGE